MGLVATGAAGALPVAVLVSGGSGRGVEGAPADCVLPAAQPQPIAVTATAMVLLATPQNPRGCKTPTPTPTPTP